MDGKAELLKRMRTVTALTGLAVVVGACLLAGTISAAQAQDADTTEVKPKPAAPYTAWVVMSAAISVVGATLAAGYAVARVGAAALGAASEKPEIMGRALAFVALAEGLAIFGVLVAVVLLLKI